MAGQQCPLGFGAQQPKQEQGRGQAVVLGKAADEALCPFPFIFLHDPLTGWALHRGKLMLVTGLLLGWVAARCLPAEIPIER